MGALYQIEFPNGKSYIGITIHTTEKRFRRHCANAGCSDKYELALSRALLKYGKKAPIVRTLAVSDDWEYLRLIERRAISIIGTKAPLGYNLTDGGEGAIGYEHDVLTREMMSKAAFETWANPEFKKKMSDIRTGRKQSPETCARRSEAIRLAWAKPGYREALSATQKEAQSRPEIREKRAASIKESWRNPEIRERRLSGRAGGKLKKEA